MLSVSTRRSINLFNPCTRRTLAQSSVCTAGAKNRNMVMKEDSSVYLNELDKVIYVPDVSTSLPTYQIMDTDGSILNKKEFPTDLSHETILSCFKGMVLLNEVDKILYQIQRQGLISFYMTAFGEEATHFGSSQALQMKDTVYGQYRETGVLIHRGFTINDIVNQCYSNVRDLGKGRQMPVHYGSAKLNFQTISSPLATQIPQAAGAAYAKKLKGDGSCVICYFGEGAASEGDFHAAMNFAATLACPVIFFCRNNKYAISTHVTEQYRGDGIAGRGVSWGMHTIRVDGNDFFAVYNATKKARSIVTSTNQPVLIEAMTYRVGHHSTSDDSTVYRDEKEILEQEKFSAINRLMRWLINENQWSEQQHKDCKAAVNKEVLAALKTAEKEKKPPISDLFSDVYDTVPDHLLQQQQELQRHFAQYGDKYKLDQFAENSDANRS